MVSDTQLVGTGCGNTTHNGRPPPVRDTRQLSLVDVVRTIWVGKTPAEVIAGVIRSAVNDRPASSAFQVKKVPRESCAPRHAVCA